MTMQCAIDSQEYIEPAIFGPGKCSHPEWNDGMPESERRTCANCVPAKVEATADWVADLLRLTKAASKGPWRVCTANDSKCSCGLIWSDDGPVYVATAEKNADEFTLPEETFQANKALLAAAPDLLDEVARLTRERDEARAIVRAGMSPGSTSAEVAAVERWNAEAKKDPAP